MARLLVSSSFEGVKSKLELAIVFVPKLPKVCCGSAAIGALGPAGGAFSPTLFWRFCCFDFGVMLETLVVLVVERRGLKAKEACQEEMNVEDARREDITIATIGMWHNSHEVHLTMPFRSSLHLSSHCPSSLSLSSHER